jgi:hypothetical protein
VISGPVPAQTTAPAPTDSSKTDDVSKSTTRQWNHAKAEWAKEKQKWTDCQNQSKNQKLTGYPSNTFTIALILSALR